MPRAPEADLARSMAPPAAAHTETSGISGGRSALRGVRRRSAPRSRQPVPSAQAPPPHPRTPAAPRVRGNSPQCRLLAAERGACALPAGDRGGRGVRPPRGFKTMAPRLSVRVPRSGNHHPRFPVNVCGHPRPSCAAARPETHPSSVPDSDAIPAPQNPEPTGPVWFPFSEIPLFPYFLF